MLRAKAALGLLLAVLVAACGPQPVADSDVRVPVDDGGSHVDITVGRLAGMLEAKDFTLVNIHVPYDGEFAPTDLFIPFAQIDDRLAELQRRAHQANGPTEPALSGRPEPGSVSPHWPT